MAGHMTPEEGARRLILRALDRALRPDVPFIAEVTGLPAAAISDIVEQVKLERSQSPGGARHRVTAPQEGHPSPLAVGPAGTLERLETLLLAVAIEAKRLRTQMEAGE